MQTRRPRYVHPQCPRSPQGVSSFSTSEFWAWRLERTIVQQVYVSVRTFRRVGPSRHAVEWVSRSRILASCSSTTFYHRILVDFYANLASSAFSSQNTSTMPLVVPMLRLAMLFLNIYDSYKVLKPPSPSSRHANRPSLRAVTQRKRNIKGCLAVWLVWVRNISHYPTLLRSPVETSAVTFSTSGYSIPLLAYLFHFTMN